MTPDFDRDVHCLLGLPIDALGIDAVVRKLRDAVRDRSRCFLSTPNLNFAIAAQSDAAFRDSVLHSDLSVADGMPLVWVAQLLGIPLRERVAGATLFERLRAGAEAPVNVYFFGGPDGVAARACEHLNAMPSALRCVGFDAPGFVPVEAMSGEAQLARIDASGADFVVVALGARKGQAWIERNRGRLQAPLISHLGAVVNFVAGTVARAPRWVQRVGLEWLWRIKEEPGLWRRYAKDGVAFVHLLVTRVVPHAIHARRAVPSPAQLAAAQLEMAADGQGIELRLRGAWSHANLAPLRAALAQAAQGRAAVRIDLGDVTHLDAAGVALLSLLWAHCARAGVPCRIDPVAPAARRVFRYCCAEYALEPLPAAARPARGAPAC